MSRQKALLALFLAGFTLPIPAMTQRNAAASQKSQPPPSVPATSTIADYIDVTDQRVWMQIRSDGAAYTNDSNLQSVVYAGDWILDTKSSTRLVFLDFSKPIPGTGPNGGPPVAPFNSALVPTRLTAECIRYNTNMFNMTPGSTINCPLAIFFSDSGKDYFLQMNPVAGAFVFTETDYVDITCNGSANSQCNDWTIGPNAAKGGCVTPDCLGSLKQNVARLSLRVPVKGKSGSWTAVNQGDFNVAFSISVTNP
jgi:hypothetical protein